jgi:hypothetical protein
MCSAINASTCARAHTQHGGGGGYRAATHLNGLAETHLFGEYAAAHVDRRRELDEVVEGVDLRATQSTVTHAHTRTQSETHSCTVVRDQSTSLRPTPVLSRCSIHATACCWYGRSEMPGKLFASSDSSSFLSQST